MSKFYFVFALLSLFCSEPVFAQAMGMTDPDEASNPQCEMIAKSCLDAGFDRQGPPGKAFWHDCMKPILFGKPVSGVTVDSQTVHACRAFKIKNLQQQLNEFKSLKNK